MKLLGQKNIAALVALLLSGVVLTSADTKSTAPVPQPEISFEEEYNFEEDLAFMEDLDEYVDEYLESFQSTEEQNPNVIKIYDAEGNLVLEEDISRNDLSEETLQMIRQAEFLTEYDDTTYYRLNS